MKNYRVLLFILGVLSCLFSMFLVFGSTTYFSNMYEDHFVYFFNIYSQGISIGLFGLLLIFILFRKAKPYHFIIVGIVNILINLVGMIYYSSITHEFYFNIYFVRGIILLLIGIYLQSNRFDIVRKISLYFFLELLVIQISSMSSDSIFYMYKTFEINLLSSIAMFIAGLSIPIIFNFFLNDKNINSDEKVNELVNIDKIIKITSGISIGYIIILILTTIPYLFAILVDADLATLIYYKVNAILRIILYSLLLYSLICVIKNNIKKWLLIAINISLIVVVMVPIFFNFQFYLDHFTWIFGIIIDLIIFIVLTVFTYYKKYKISFFISIWFLINFLLASLEIGNIQKAFIFNFLYDRVGIFMEIFYYLLPITLVLLLYRRMKSNQIEN